jgi:hypothetical protein
MVQPGLCAENCGREWAYRSDSQHFRPAARDYCIDGKKALQAAWKTRSMRLLGGWMSETSSQSRVGYRPPEPIPVPPLYAWPPRPLATFRWIFAGLLYVRVTAGDQFHQLHHPNFEVNYGNTPTPLDKLFGTWHDGTAAAHAALKHRRRARQLG